MARPTIHKEIEPYIPMVKAIVELFHPFVEAAVHDLKLGKVVDIYHNISRRKVGDPTPIHEMKVPVEKFPDYFHPYFKTNWDGKELKCVSVTIRDPKGFAVGLICFNVDVSFFQQIESTFKSFLQVDSKDDNPLVMFSDNWKEQITCFIEEYLRDHMLSKTSLDRNQKKALVKNLFDKGVFHFKNAAPFIAQYLGASRASIYNYLKEELS